jgi:hypothetical protein
MANRILRDWTFSENVDALNFEAEVFFTRLIMKADDFGCFHGNPKLLKAALFPLKEIKQSIVEKMLNDCVEAGIIILYEVDSKKYLKIVDFGQRLRTMNSKFPQLDSNARTIVSNAPLEVERNEVEVEEETKKNKVASLQKSFSFKNELLNLNFDEQLVDEWLSIRKAKKAKNTETALKAFIREIKKSNLPANEILQICVERSWSGFDASWINNLNTNKNGNTQQPINNEERKRSYIERVLYGNNEPVDSQRSHNGENNSAFDAVEIVES